MFTGIVQAVGRVQSIEGRGGDRRIGVATGKLSLDTIQLGDSVAVNGVCLTAVEFSNGCFQADVSTETLTRTTLGDLQKGSPVNLELALTPSSRLGGHFVSGHVDGMGWIAARHGDARSERISIGMPEGLARYIAEKGSICVDGVSLTVNQVSADRFDVNIVPHTLAETTLGESRVGQAVNLEVDLLARYLERLLLMGGGSGHSGGLSYQTLLQAGFVAGSHEHD